VSFAASLAPVLLLAAAAAGLGAALLAAALPGTARALPRPRPAAAAADAAAVAVVAGLVLLFVLLLALDAAGVAWRRVSLAGGVLLLAAVLGSAAVLRLRTAAPEPAAAAAWPGPGWGAAVAAAVTAAFAWAASTRRVAIPDFVYHWGLKGKRYHLAGGVDVPFLADPLHLTDHPDYPNLLPSLYAATAHVRGWFDEVSMLLWSVVFLLLLAVFARTALVRGGARGAWLEAGTAVVALVSGMVAVGYDLAGGADLALALAVVMALPALLPADGDGTAETREARRADDLRVGLAAALAAGTKIEGVVLAALLLAARGWAGRAGPGGAARGGGRGRLLARLPWLAVPPAAVVLPWLATALHHGLFSGDNAGALDLGRLGIVLPAAAEALGTREWRGFPWLLLLLPWPLALRRTRTAAALVALQAGFYLAIYLAAPVDTRFYVLSSLPRLLVHLVPPLLVLLVLAAATPARRPRR
jgi:hypothetical protein